MKQVIDFLLEGKPQNETENFEEESFAEYVGMVLPDSEDDRFIVKGDLSTYDDSSDSNGAEMMTGEDDNNSISCEMEPTSPLSEKSHISDIENSAEALQNPMEQVLEVQPPQRHAVALDQSVNPW